MICEGIPANMSRSFRSEPPHPRRKHASVSGRRGQTVGLLISLLLMLAIDAWLLVDSGLLQVGAEPPKAEGTELPSPTVPAPPPESLDQTTVRFGQLDFHVVEVDLAQAELGLFWKAPGSGERFGRLGTLEEFVKQRGGALEFATNAGMFQPDHRPVGLHVEEGRELAPLDERTGLPGNFYLAPNGVFFVRANGQPGIQTTAQFARKRPGDLRLATQSGPMLVIDGKIHAMFNPQSQSRFIRSGVGWRGGTRLVFALSATPVTFHEFARLFLERYGCPEALYLDGAISRFHAPGLGHPDPEGDFGGILAIVREAPRQKTATGVKSNGG